MRRALLPLLLISFLSVVGFRAQTPSVQDVAAKAAEDTYTLVHKYKTGESQAVTMKIEGKFGEMNFVSTVDLSQKVTEVAADGGYTVEVTTDSSKTTLNGEDVPIEDDGESKTQTRKYDAKGERILDAGEEEGEDTPFDTAFEYEPKEPVKIGDTWTPAKKKDDSPEPLEWTLTGKEDLGGKEALVLVGKGKAEDVEAIESKVWLDPVTFTARKATAVIRGIKQEEAGDGEMTISIEEKS